MTQTFTPGPWTITDRDDLFRIREEASDAVLATTDDGGHPTETIFDYDTQRANAHLIATAPELYAELERLYELLRRGGYAVAGNTAGILAKARGEAVSA